MGKSFENIKNVPKLVPDCARYCILGTHVNKLATPDETN
ncbi:MAG: hypothetical protein K0S23_2738 [Fluviicola sp.]|jgi:hypothetical protein|nr:hypothetical protein [Fluviicola sp.]